MKGKLALFLVYISDRTSALLACLHSHQFRHSPLLLLYQLSFEKFALPDSIYQLFIMSNFFRKITNRVDDRRNRRTTQSPARGGSAAAAGSTARPPSAGATGATRSGNPRQSVDNRSVTSGSTIAVSGGVLPRNSQDSSRTINPEDYWVPDQVRSEAIMAGEFAGDAFRGDINAPRTPPVPPRNVARHLRPFYQQQYAAGFTNGVAGQNAPPAASQPMVLVHDGRQRRPGSHRDDSPSARSARSQSAGRRSQSRTR